MLRIFSIIFSLSSIHVSFASQNVKEKRKSTIYISSCVPPTLDNIEKYLRALEEKNKRKKNEPRSHWSTSEKKYPEVI